MKIKENNYYCMDCLEGLKLLQEQNIQPDLVVTSPPYDNLRSYNGYSFDFESIAKELYKTIKDGGILVWIVADSTIKGSETGTSFKQALYFKEIGFNLHDTMIYQKDAMAFPNSKRYHQVFEYMFIFSKGTPKTINLIQDRKNITAGQKRERRTQRQKDGTLKKIERKTEIKEYGTRFNIWRYPTGLHKSTKDLVAFKHPAIFPEPLARDHILSWSNEGDLVLDIFAGSGTTLKAARDLNRKFIGFEISEEYIDIIKERLNT